MLRAALLVFAAALLPAVHAQERVEFDSLDVAGGKPVRLLGHWFATPAAKPDAPALVLLHGCGGPYARSGRLDERMHNYAALLNARGAHALVLDSLTPRGEKELCTQKGGTRRVTQANRRLDALAALAWLARRSGVDPQRIGLLGWSNGGSTVLAAINTRHPTVAAASAKAAFAVAFYPGCEAELKRGFESPTPLLMLVGEADDWTAAAPCHELAGAAAGPVKPAIEGYAGAYHGFDSNAPVRLRKDVPGGVKPGQGVHVGGDALARDASRQRLMQFVAQH
ncbi:MAG: dienelactone hydrolase family protein [Burkholderiaceae bacterium]